MPSLQLLVLFAWSLLQQTVVSMPQTAGALIPAPAPELAGPSSAATAPSCGGCYLVADVVGLVWYDEILRPVVGTQVVSIAVGNGSQVTRTIYSSAEVQFTYTPGAIATGGSAFINFDSTYEIAGQLLTSPTAYNVYSAYSITSSYTSNGECVTTQLAPSTLATGFTQVLSSASGKVFLNAEGEQSFINSLGFSSCSGGGANIVPISLIQVQPSTLTTTQSFSSVSLAAASRTLPPTTQPTKSSRTGSITLSTLIVTSDNETSSSTITSFVTPKPSYPVVSAPVLVFNHTTITPNPTPLPYPIYDISGITGSVSVVVPTGTGAGSGNYTTVVPYISQGIRSWRSLGGWVELWVAGAIGLGAALYFL